MTPPTFPDPLAVFSEALNWSSVSCLYILFFYFYFFIFPKPSSKLFPLSFVCSQSSFVCFNIEDNVQFRSGGKVFNFNFLIHLCFQFSFSCHFFLFFIFFKECHTINAMELLFEVFISEFCTSQSFCS